MTDIIDNGDFEVNPDLDHGALQGLTDDDHAQYALLVGRTGGQTLNGGISPGDSLTLRGSNTVGVSGMVKLAANEHLIPVVDNVSDLGVGTIINPQRFRNVYVSGNLSDGVNTVSVVNCLTAYTHSQIGNVAPHVPTGSILMFGSATPPTGYLLCDGAAVSQVTYAALYAVVGLTFGNPGGGNFNLPDFGINFPKGYKSGTNSVGDIGGAATHTPAGSVAAPVFTGTALGTHQHDAITAGTPAGTVPLAYLPGTNVNAVAPNTKIAASFVGIAMGTHQHAAITAGTPAGSNSAPAFTGTNADYQPAFLVVSFIIKA